jgi:hypothetical protein
LDRFACIARRRRRIPLRYQALPFCARPTFVRSSVDLQRASPAQHLRFRLGRFRRDRKYSGWMANVKGPRSGTFPARFAGGVRRIRRSSVTLRVPTCQCNDIRAVRPMDGATTEKIRIPI